MFKKAANIALAAGFAAFATSASALLITSEGSNSVDFEVPCVESQAPGCEGLLGTGSLTVSGFNSNELTLQITLTNDSTSELEQIRLTAFGFGITPDVDSVSFQDGNDNGIVAAALIGPGQNFPNDGGVIDVCAYAGANCAGGGGGPTVGLLPGQSDTFTLLLGGEFGDEVAFDFLGVRFQTDGGSFSFTCANGDCADGGGGPGGEVPEPGALWLLGLGLVGIAAVNRRRRHT